MILTLQLLGALALVLANGFFVATEFAIARIRLTQVQELEASGAAGAKSLRHAVESLDAYLAACQLGITIASIGLGIVGKPAFEALIEPLTGPLGNAAYVISFGFSFAIVSLLHVVFGELAPKSLAIARNTRTALLIAPPMRVFYLGTKPIVDFFNWLGNLVLKPFGIPPAREVGHAPHSEREIRELMRESVEEGLIDASDLEFTEGVFSFGDLRVRDVVVPRPDVVALPVDLPPAEALAAVVDAPYTRYPVYRDSLDEIVGILHARDLFAAGYKSEIEQLRIEELLRPAHLVPETKGLADLLAEFRHTKQHLAIVVDEYGSFQGIVTLEDLIEEIVGEIEDELDRPAEAVVPLSEGRVRIEGTLSVDEFNERFGQELPRGHYHTIAGFAFGQLGHGAQVGDEVFVDGVCFRVVEVEGSRIVRLEAEFGAMRGVPRVDAEAPP